MDLQKLKEPFPYEEIEWRLQSCGESNGKIWARCLAYVSNRAIQNRLDEVVGAENWKNEFQKAPDGGVLCGLSIRCDGEWITKYDGAENTDIEAVKGGLSNSMKRAAATGWGIGRYLYRLDDSWAIITNDGRYTGKTREGKFFKWNPPALPDWALPKVSSKEFEELVVKAEEWLNSDVLSSAEKEKAKSYIDTKNMTGLKKFLDYCKTKPA